MKLYLVLVSILMLAALFGPIGAAWPRPGSDSAFLGHTEAGRAVIRKYLELFRNPACCRDRRGEIVRYFRHHYDLPQALDRPFKARCIVLHGTENDSEAETYAIFNTPHPEYLGGIWSHFAVAGDGTVYQYAPLNRVSKAQFGANDLALGIEMVGRIGSGGSLLDRYRKGDRRQVVATVDLVNTLQRRYSIPSSRVFSHEEVGHIRDLKGSNPDYDWLRRNIRDRVYLGKFPELDRRGLPTRKGRWLEPYDRYDPGREIMIIIRRLL